MLWCKFPRLSDKYQEMIALGRTDAEARSRADQKLLEKGEYKPLDVAESVEPIENPLFDHYQAVVRYLSSKCKSELTGVEKLRLEGVRSKLLIVDDKVDTREAIVVAAEEAGLYEIEQCGQPSDAVEIVRDSRPEVLVMKHNMATKNGFQVMHELRKEGVVQKTVMYGRFHEEIAAAYLKHTSAHFFVKEYDPNKIIGAVERTLNDERGKTLEDFIIHD